MSEFEDLLPKFEGPETKSAEGPEAFKASLHAAFAKAQGQFRTPKLNRTAKIYKDLKLLYTTHYADIEEIIDCVRQPLYQNGLSFKQLIQQRSNNAWYLVLELAHDSGQTQTSEMPLNMNQPSQQVGSQLTYYKRYQLAAFFGLAAEFDDDGGATEDKQAQFSDGPGKKPTQQITAAIPFPLQDKAEPLFSEEVPETLLDKLIMLKVTKDIPDPEMKSIVQKVTGTSKPSNRLTLIELEKVIGFIQKFK